MDSNTQTKKKWENSRRKENNIKENRDKRRRGLWEMEREGRERERVERERGIGDPLTVWAAFPSLPLHKNYAIEDHYRNKTNKQSTMPVSEYLSQLDFLKDSASSLSSESPSTAAHLLAVHNHILHNDFKSLNMRQQELCCGACGTIRSPETSKTIQIKKKKSKRTGISTDGATIYKCLRCHRRTVKPVRKEPVRSKAPTKSTTTTVEASVSTTAPSTDKTVSEQSASEPASKTAENASSKKRAKARKQGGLQALLASKQKSQSASSSLDLFDFLQ